VVTIAASAATFARRRLALHALTVHGAAGFGSEDWDRLGADLSDGARNAGRRIRLSPARAMVTVYGAGSDQSLVRLTAPDQAGLLWAVSDWLASQGVSIESLDASTTDGVAHDGFLVSGEVAASDLSRHLSRGSGGAASATRDAPGLEGCVRTRRG